MPELEISLCTVCMNRLHHLQKTLPSNIEDNLAYNRIRHILLDYNSSDGLGDWVRDNMGKYLESGRLIYYRTEEPTRFNMAHSKNLAVKLSNSEYVGLVDADNYTGKGYAKYISNTFHKFSDVFITSIPKGPSRNPVDVLGRVCFRRGDFDLIGGFDEYMNDYGYDDFDLCNRLANLGRRRFFLKKKEFLRAISHSNAERIKNQDIGIVDIYVHNIAYDRSSFLFTFKDGTYSIGTIIDRQNMSSKLVHKAFSKPAQIKEPFKLVGGWRSCTSQNVMNAMYLRHEEEIYPYRQGQQELVFAGKLYKKVQDKDDIQWLKYIYSVLKNLVKSKINDRKKTISVNGNGFGKGTVSMNFGPTKIID